MVEVKDCVLNRNHAHTVGVAAMRKEGMVDATGIEPVTPSV